MGYGNEVSYESLKESNDGEWRFTSLMKNFFSKQIIRTSTNESTNNVVAKIKSVMHQNDILPPKYTTFQSKSEGDSLDAPDDIASILPLTGEIAAVGGGRADHATLY